MQNIKFENVEPSKVLLTPDRKAQNREKHLLTFIVKATARDQEKNMLISKLQREISEAAENLEALQAEVTLKDKLLHVKEDELSTIKSENETLKQQLQQLLTNMAIDNKHDNNNVALKNDVHMLNNFKTPMKHVYNNVGLKKHDNDVKNKYNKSPVNDNNGFASSLTPMFVRKWSRKKSDKEKKNKDNNKSPTDKNTALPNINRLTPIITRKRSLKQPPTPKENVTGLFYNLRKKTKK